MRWKHIVFTITILMGWLVIGQTINAAQIHNEESKGTPGVITLPQALSLALMHNPELAVYSWEIRNSEAKVLQSGLIPNPELGFEAEGIGEHSADASLTPIDTIQLSQVIELGDKRAKRFQLARTEHSLAGWDYETKRLEVLAETGQEFIDVLTQQERLKLIQDLTDLADRVLTAVTQQVAAGKVSPLEEIKAMAGLAAIKIEREQVKSGLVSSRKRLAALWGANSADYERVDGRLDNLAEPATWEQVSALVERNPDIARWTAETAKRQAALKLEEANKIVDVTLSGAVQSVRVDNDTAFILGITVPIPLFNRNQGNILEAQNKLLAAEDERKAAQIKINTLLAEAHQALSFSFDQARALKAEVLPAAQMVYEATQEGYRQGKFDLLYVLDAQRTFFDAKRQYNEALSAYHKALVDIERLTGDTYIR